jgi:hypothetical protein
MILYFLRRQNNLDQLDHQFQLRRHLNHQHFQRLLGKNHHRHHQMLKD